MPQPLTRKTWTRSAALLIALGALGMVPAGAADRGDHLVLGTVQDFQHMGSSVAVSGDTAIIGSPGADNVGTVDPGESAGLAHVFTQVAPGDWEELQTLMPASAEVAVNNEFGTSVDIDGDVIVIGSLRGDGATDNVGTAHVFERTAGVWNPVVTLAAAGGADGDQFGRSVAVSGDTIAVGAPMDDALGFDAGAVHVYRRDGAGAWNFEQKVAGNDTDGSDLFGFAVDLDGDTLVASGPAKNDGPELGGAGYVFTRTGNTWIQEQKITPADGGSNDNFGASVAVDGDTAVFGADFGDNPAPDSGAAYVYTRDTGVWTLEQKLASGDVDADDRFGESVALDGNRVVVGAPVDEAETFATGVDPEVLNAGAAWLFLRSGTTWGDAERLIAALPMTGARFGDAVAVSGPVIMVGSPTADESVTQDGFVDEFLTVVNVPPPDLIRSFLLPKKIDARGTPGKKKGPGADVKAFFDTGPDEVDFTAAAVVTLGGLEIPIPGLQAIKNGKFFTFSNDTLSIKVKPSSKGTSKGSFNLKYRGDLGEGFDPNGPFTVSYVGGGIDASGTVVLANGKFTFGKKPGTLVAPALDIRKAKAKLPGVGRHGFKLVAGFTTEGGAPATAPDVIVAFGDVFNAVIPGEAFVKKGDKFTFKGNEGGITNAILDYRKERITVKGKDVDLGDVPDGPQPLLLILERDDDVRAVVVRATRTKKVFGY